MSDRKAWRPFLFQCPQTGLKVQGMVAEESAVADGAHYEAVSCVACSGVHFINPQTGLMLGTPRGGSK